MRVVAVLQATTPRQQLNNRKIFTLKLEFNSPPDTVWRQSSQPITWLIVTNKTVQENTQTKYNSKKQTMQNYQNYPGSVASNDTEPGNDISLF